MQGANNYVAFQSWVDQELGSRYIKLKLKEKPDTLQLGVTWVKYQGNGFLLVW